MDEIAGGLSVLALGFAVYSLVLTSRGPAVGQDVDLLDTKTEGALPELSKDGHTFPLTLEAGQDYRFYLILRRQSALPRSPPLEGWAGTADQDPNAEPLLGVGAARAAQ